VRAAPITSTIASIARKAAAKLRGGARRAAQKAFEWRYGVHTDEFIYLEDLDLQEEGRVWHDASEWISLDRALRRLRVGEQDVFVDLGSGLGRAVLVAARLPFGRVIGVDVAESFNEVARANVEKNRSRLRCGRVDIVTADATTWAVPDDLSVAYMYSPVFGEPFERIVANLLSSVDEHPRPLRLVYNYPIEHARLLATGRARLLHASSGSWPSRDLTRAEVILTYLLLPSDPAVAAPLVARFPQQVDGAEAWLGPYDPGFVLERPDDQGGRVRIR
jgi:SAM-dependent methyltransferase